VPETSRIETGSTLELEADHWLTPTVELTIWEFRSAGLAHLYKALLRGVQSARRKNDAGQMGTVVSRLRATPAVRGLVLTAVPGVLAARTRSKSKSTSGSTGTQLGIHQRLEGRGFT
jgi:hypothetical protein